jgi:hypothetical protein
MVWLLLLIRFHYLNIIHLLYANDGHHPAQRRNKNPGMWWRSLALPYYYYIIIILWLKLPTLYKTNKPNLRRHPHAPMPICPSSFARFLSYQLIIIIIYVIVCAPMCVYASPWRARHECVVCASSSITPSPSSLPHCAAPHLLFIPSFMHLKLQFW